MEELTKFKSWRAFPDFESQVRRNRRFIRTLEADGFLNSVKETIHSRISRLSSGRGLWRAQLGFEWRYDEQIGEEIPQAFGATRMKPLRDRAFEGRANPAGIPMLYLCTSKDAAMSEVRPWLGSMVSLGQFKLTKDLRVVDCTKGEASSPRFLIEDPGTENWDNAVWADIDRAFTRPVTRDDSQTEYVSTQILVELFRSEGYDGIAYKSAFGEKSTNIALFDLDCADLVGCQLHEASSLRFNFRERDNPYFVRKKRRK